MRWRIIKDVDNWYLIQNFLEIHKAWVTQAVALTRLGAYWGLRKTKKRVNRHQLLIYLE